MNTRIAKDIKTFFKELLTIDEKEHTVSFVDTIKAEYSVCPQYSFTHIQVNYGMKNEPVRPVRQL